MKKLFIKLTCIAFCAVLLSFAWGCKVETVAQHEQAASQETVSSQVESVPSEKPDAESENSQETSSAESEKEKPSSSQSSSSHTETPASQGTSQESPDRNVSSVQASAENPPESTAASSASQPQSSASSAEPEPESIVVSISVLCPLAVGNPNLNPGISLPENGVMVSGLTVELSPGQTAFDALKATGLSLDYSGSPARKNVYLKGVGGLYERDCGPGSGWVFSVNGTYPRTGCSNVVLNAGDTVEFQYTDGRILS